MNMDQNNNRSSSKKPDLIRKKRKPLMEKRRRARINASLEQLKKLVLDATRKDSARYSKLEKADILELTVRHLRDVQRNNMSYAMSQNPQVMSQFTNGFAECTAEVDRYLSTISGIPRETHARLLTHLSGLAQNGHMVSQPPSPISPGRNGLPNMSVFIKNNVACNPHQSMHFHSPTPSATSLQSLPGAPKTSSSSPSTLATPPMFDNAWSHCKLPVTPPSSPRENLQETIMKQRKFNFSQLNPQHSATVSASMKPLVSMHPEQFQPKNSSMLYHIPELQTQHKGDMFKGHSQASTMDKLLREAQKGHQVNAKSLQLLAAADENVWRPW